MKNKRKTIFGWLMFDWANSAYSLIITSTILPVYYNLITTKEGGDTTVTFLNTTWENTALYSFAIGFSFLVFAVMAPFINTIADKGANKLHYLRFFTYLGVLSCLSLYFFNVDTLSLGIISIVFASIGFCGSQTFYNSYLNDIATKDRQDSISAKGFSYGYVGSVLLQLICLLFFFFPDSFGLIDDKQPYKISFLLVGFWWFIFAQFSFSRLRAVQSERIHKKVFEILKGVAEKIRTDKTMFLFVLSFFFYSAGLQTVMLVASLFAAKEIKMEGQELIIVILILQLIAIVGALFIAKMSKIFGNFRTIFFILFLWIACCIAAYFITTKTEFYILAVLIGFVMGGTQALSRSTYSKLIPVLSENENASFFSFYDLTEKMAIVLGMFSFAFIEQISGSIRNSVLSIIVFFVASILFLAFLYNKRLENK